MKTRLHLAQGVRLFNYYLLAGSINPPLDERRALARSALMLGYRFDATRLERSAARIGTDGRPACLLVATARHMDAAVQQRLVDHVAAGGSLLALGPVPEADLSGAACGVLAEAFGLRPGPVLAEGPHSYPNDRP